MLLSWKLIYKCTHPSDKVVCIFPQIEMLPLAIWRLNPPDKLFSYRLHLNNTVFSPCLLAVIVMYQRLALVSTASQTNEHAGQIAPFCSSLAGWRLHCVITFEHSWADQCTSSSLLQIGTMARFCLLLRVSSDYARPITGQVTSVTWPVIGWPSSELTLSKRQKTGPDHQ